MTKRKSKHAEEEVPAKLRAKADAAKGGIVETPACQAAREHFAQTQAAAEAERRRLREGRNSRDGDQDESVYVTVKLAAQLTGIEEGRVIDLIAAGKISAVTAGDMMLIPMSSLRRYLASRRCGEKQEGGAMSPGLERQLVEKYPELFADYGAPPDRSPRAFGFECGDGWFDLIDVLCAQLARLDPPGEDLPLKAMQVEVVPLRWTGWRRS